MEKLVPARHARAVLIGACLLPLVLGAWLVYALPQSPDLWYYKNWSRLVTRHGLSSAYSGKPSADYVDYPPVLLYPWKVEGEIYQRCVDPSFDEEAMFDNEWHTFGLALIAVLFHIATGLALWWLAKKRHAERVAAAVAALYLLNPAALYNVAYLGLPDSAHSLWLVLAFGLAELGHARGGWALAALAALTKPQAWGLMPLFAWRRFQTDGAKKFLTGLGVVAGTSLVVVAPFIFNGKLGELLRLPLHMGDVQAVVSAQAHNLWWLVTLGEGLHTRDSNPLLGPVTYHVASLVLLAASGFFTLWRSQGARPELMLVLPAFQAFAWFCLTTRAHENHWFFVLPLLALALPGAPAMLKFFLALTATGFLNLLLHDDFVMGKLHPLLPPNLQLELQLLNSTANIFILAAWTVWLVRQPAPGARPVSPPGGEAAGQSPTPAGG